MKMINTNHKLFFSFFSVDLLQMLEFNVTARFPIAPLLIVILALVGKMINCELFYIIIEISYPIQ